MRPWHLLVAAMLATHPAWSATLTVSVTKVRDAQGFVRVCLFASARDFPDCSGKSVAARANVPARAGEVTVTFADLAPGVYAVSAYHDEANRGRLTTNFLGIPRDGVAASRDARGRFGPPRFGDAAFTLAGSGAIRLSLVYP